MANRPSLVRCCVAANALKLGPESRDCAVRVCARVVSDADGEALDLILDTYQLITT